MANKKLTAAEARYSRFKVAMKDPRLSPSDEAEVRAIGHQLRKSARAKYFGTGMAGIIAGVLSLVLIVGFILLPLGCIAIVQGVKEIRSLRMCEDRYITNREWEKVSA
ncbi:hypothetical protein NPJ88_000040 [Halomonas elongata]|uniref:hypothetical protein n=1 Tax=Halomonas elongata TaxID=2746 RepID=UPI00255A730C|nr:hypothetical protein [Halomonas elongata]MDL4860711.1 hypothetical protein [Halomonas elongata]